MYKLLKVMVLSALVFSAACSKQDENKTEKLIIQSGETNYEYKVEVVAASSVGVPSIT